MDWDLDKGEILKTSKNEFDWLKMIFSWKKAYAIIFAKFQLISSPFEELPYFTPDLLRYQIMDWDLDKGEILKTSKNEFDWLKMIFFMKEGIRDHNVQNHHFAKMSWRRNEHDVSEEKIVLFLLYLKKKLQRLFFTDHYNAPTKPAPCWINSSWLFTI